MLVSNVETTGTAFDERGSISEAAIALRVSARGAVIAESVTRELYVCQ
jgi:hypothetical protein